MPAHAILLWEASDIRGVLLRRRCMRNATTPVPEVKQSLTQKVHREKRWRGKKLVEAGQNRTAGTMPAATSKFLIKGVRKAVY